MIKEDHENNVDVFKEPQAVEALDSFGKTLPVELSFIIQQQAVCMARMNKLDREVRELKESGKLLHSSCSSSFGHHLHHNNHHHQQQAINSNTGTTPTSTATTTTTTINHANSRFAPINLTQIHNSNHQRNSHQHQIHHLHQLNTFNQNHDLIGAQLQATPNNQKIGHFIHSDDSGGEFSRATNSDDDELSSLLDQIAKSVRPERNIQPQAPQSTPSNPHNQYQLHRHQHHQQQSTSTPTANYNQRAHYSLYNPATMLASAKSHHQLHYTQITNPQQTSYASATTTINPSQLHPHPHHHHILTPQHQPAATAALPVFVMSSPFAVAAHPSSISSAILPGVHFQPEPRYNQYYEDFHSSTGSTLNRHPQQQNVTLTRNQTNQNFDTSISAIEQIVSQREKKQVKSQLKCADNWLKMRSGAISDLDSNTFGLASVPNGAHIVGSNNSDVQAAATGNGNNQSTNNEVRANFQGLSLTAAAGANDKTNCMIEET